MKVSQLMRKVRVEVEKPYEEKLEQTEKLIICQLKEHPWSCVSCSFGKDSVVVLDLVRKYYPDIYVVFNNTRVQHPETYKFKDFLKKEWSLKLLETKPLMSFWRVADLYGLPDGRKELSDKALLKRRMEGKPIGNGRRIDICCKILKEYPMHRLMKRFKFSLTFTGLTAIESRRRNLTIDAQGCSYLLAEGYWKTHPIAYWTPQDVWRYIEENNIPVNPIYDKISRLCNTPLLQVRSGCAFCTAYKGWRKEMSNLYPGIYKLICNKYFSQKVLI